MIFIVYRSNYKQYIEDGLIHHVLFIDAMGKPVITQIGEEEMTIIPECPFINITLDGVTETIITLMEDEMLRKDLGRKARDYVVEIHDARKVARLCIEKYKELLET